MPSKVGPLLWPSRAVQVKRGLAAGGGGASGLGGDARGCAGPNPEAALGPSSFLAVVFWGSENLLIWVSSRSWSTAESPLGRLRALGMQRLGFWGTTGARGAGDAGPW